MLPTTLAAKVALLTGVGVMSLSGVAAAAYTGSLPSGLQDLAHHTIGAPASHHGSAPGTQPSPGATPVGPDATGSAAYGLCTAWKAADGHPDTHAVAYRNLAAAAGGASRIAAYCANVPRPSASPESSEHATGAPATTPSVPPSSVPPTETATATPGATPSARPTDLPSPTPSAHPTGQPTSVPPTHR